MTTCTINNIYPWGRSFDEYRRMFALSDEDLNGRIVGCADGPAAFNATMHRMGRRVVSVDPLYQFTADEIRSRIEATYAIQLKHVADQREQFIWNDIASAKALGDRRMSAMNEFLADYEAGRRQGRYLVGSLPSTDLPDRGFDLALCSHYLFLYSNEVSFDEHLASIREMCRVAREIRVFPLLNMEAKRSKHLEPIVTQLRRDGFAATIDRVPYEFLRGANQMLRITRA